MVYRSKRRAAVLLGSTAVAMSLLAVPWDTARACSCGRWTEVANRDELPVGASLILTHGCGIGYLTARVDGAPVQIVFGPGSDPDTATLSPAPTLGQIVDINDDAGGVTLVVTAEDLERPAAPTFEARWQTWEPECSEYSDEGIMVMTDVSMVESGGMRYWVTILADGEVALEAVHVADAGDDRFYDFLEASYEGIAELCVHVRVEDPSGNVSEETVSCIEGPPEGTLGPDPGGDGDDDDDEDEDEDEEDEDEDVGEDEDDGDDEDDGGGDEDEDDLGDAADGGDGVASRGCSVSGDPSAPGALVLGFGLLFGWVRRGARSKPVGSRNR